MKTTTYFLLLCLTGLCLPAKADTQIVLFGDTIGHVYYPGFVDLEPGDTILFIGNFTEHPMSSVTVPSGAEAFGMNSGGDTLMLVPTVPGTYTYQCDIHWEDGMTGAFRVRDPMRIGKAPEGSASAVFPSVTESVIHVWLSENITNSTVLVEIYNMLGQKMRGFEQTEQTVSYSLSTLPDGHYIVILRRGSTVIGQHRITRRS